MKKLIHTVCLLSLLLIFAVMMVGCSASYHLRMALEKNPDIIDVKADTTTNVSSNIWDSTIYWEYNQPVSFDIDTGYAESKDTIDYSNYFDLQDTVMIDSARRINDSIGMASGVLVVLPGIDIDTVRAYSPDSSAVAESWVTRGSLYTRVWGRIDTSVVVRDTTVVERTVRDTVKVVTKSKEATIHKKEPLSKTIQRWIVIVGAVLLVLLFTLIIVKWKKIF